MEYYSWMKRNERIRLYLLLKFPLMGYNREHLDFYHVHEHPKQTLKNQEDLTHPLDEKHDLSVHGLGEIK